MPTTMAPIDAYGGTKQSHEKWLRQWTATDDVLSERCAVTEIWALIIKELRWRTDKGVPAQKLSIVFGFCTRHAAWRMWMCSGA